MYNSYIIYIENYDDLVECQKILIKEGIFWKNSQKDEIVHSLSLPIYLFIKNDKISWSDEKFHVYQSSSPVFNYKEYLKLKKM